MVADAVAVAVGMALTVVVGILLGIVMGTVAHRSNTAARSLHLNALYAIPRIRARAV